MIQLRDTHRREQGLTVVEVLVAMLVLAAVMGGLAMAMASSTTIRGKAKVSASMAATANRVKETLASDRGWMERADCRARTGCAITWLPADRLVDPDLDTTWQFAGIARGTDSKADGLGAADRDGVQVDYFQLEFSIAAPAAHAARLGKPKALEVVTALDEKGQVPRGSLLVEVCRSTNQVDERMSIQGCVSTGNANEMLPCPPQPQKGCNEAWATVAGLPPHASNPSPHVNLVRQAGVSFTLSSPFGRWSSAGKEVAPGQFQFANLPMGSYRITGVSNVPGHVRWLSKEIPASHSGNGSLNVEYGTRSRAMLLYRPADAGVVHFKFKRRIGYWHFIGPLEHREKIVNKLPTSGYGGTLAANAIMGEPQQNCVTYLFTGHSSTTVAEMEALGIPEDTIDDTGAAARYMCTHYDVDLRHVYWRPALSHEQDLWGAARSVVYSAEPRPDYRVVEYPAGVPTEVSRRFATTERVTTTATLSGIPTGLNASVLRSAGNPAHVKQNEFHKGLPPQIGGARMWVYPNGNVAGLGIAPTVHILGKGECYWSSPNYKGWHESSCDPCQPLWTIPGGVVDGGCGAVLLKSDWRKRVYYSRVDCRKTLWNAAAFPTCQTTTSYSQLGGSRYGQFVYDEPVGCTGLPSLAPGNGSCSFPVAEVVYEIPEEVHDPTADTDVETGETSGGGDNWEDDQDKREETKGWQVRTEKVRVGRDS